MTGGKAGNPRMAQNITYMCDAAWVWAGLSGTGGGGGGVGTAYDPGDITLDFVSGLHNCLEFSQPLQCLYKAMQTQEKRSLLLL